MQLLLKESFYSFFTGVDVVIDTVVFDILWMYVAVCCLSCIHDKSFKLKNTHEHIQTDGCVLFPLRLNYSQIRVDVVCEKKKTAYCCCAVLCGVLASDSANCVT